VGEMSVKEKLAAYRSYWARNGFSDVDSEGNQIVSFEESSSGAILHVERVVDGEVKLTLFQPDGRHVYHWSHTVTLVMLEGDEENRRPQPDRMPAQGLPWESRANTRYPRNQGGEG
jgi:hypothetical protein